ncbi:hypothetical protein HYV82_00870 [Candidatus Woesearchaeota archaeon]|nr:hypothetical protein [Candidatus Woesearchaeota archaeon]
MTINIDIYCKRQPTVSDLVAPLKLEPAIPIEGYETYRWVPNVPNAGGNRILIALKQIPEIVSDAYDKKSIDERIALARFAGIEVPEGLVQKFMRDNLGSSGQLRTIAVEHTGSSVREPLTARPSCPENEGYTIRADRELYEFAAQFPHLEDVAPWFKLPFQIAKFTRGEPTYYVGLETTVSVSRVTIGQMSDLAVYYAKAFDGIVYDEDNNKFGTPNPDELHRQGMDLFIAVANAAKAQGARVIPADF